MNIEIRRAQTIDVPLLIELYCRLVSEEAELYDNYMDFTRISEFSNKHFTNLLLCDSCASFIAQNDGMKLLGYVTGCIKISHYPDYHKHLLINSIFVLPNARGVGIGSKLVQELLSWAVPQDVKKCTVMVYFDNEMALSFYRKIGFVPSIITLENAIK